MMKESAEKKILVVDDSATMRMYLCVTLKKVMHGIAVSEAVHGADAVEKLKKSDFDLVLTDLSMPEMDGIQLISEIRGPMQMHVPIIVITTKGEERDRDRGIGLGANGYITKPVNFFEFKETVLKCLQRHEAVPA